MSPGAATAATLPLDRHRRARTSTGAAATWAITVGNAAAIVWLWYHGGNVTDVHDTGEALTSLARLTGLLGAYAALVQVLLLARIPELERLVGLDRLSIWHRWNGHACLYLILGHVACSFYGYALMDGVSLPAEVTTMLGGGNYPGMITATVGTVLFVVVVLSSIVVARKRLPYEWWYAVHLSAYAAIALGWFHQVPTGNELVLSTVAADYWASLYLATLGVLLAFRVLRPVVDALRFRMRVAAVVAEAPGVVSLTITGRRLDRLGARAGQFFLWRFLAEATGGGRIRSRSRRRPTGARCGSRSRRSATSRAGSARSRPGRASSRRGHSASSPNAPAAATRSC